MITLNVTIGGNLEISLNKNSKQDLKELIDKATNTDLILYDLLEMSSYIGNDWHVVEGVLTETLIVARGSIYESEDDDYPTDYESTWFYPDYMIKSFANELLTNKRVIFKKV
jgi:hypothetical protein